MALFAVVHGSMAGSAAYTRLAKELSRRGQQALLVELPVDRPELTGTDYARMVAKQLDAALAEDGVGDEPVVVVAHSASGLLLPLVPCFHPVAHLVYLAAGVPQPGMTLDDLLRAEPDMLNPAWVGVDPFQDHQAARRFLFHDCDEATARWAIAAQTPWYPEGLYSERCPLGAFPAGPQHLDRVHRRPGHPAGLVPAGRQRPAARPGDRAARWPLPARVPPGATGRGPDRDHHVGAGRC